MHETAASTKAKQPYASRKRKLDVTGVLVKILYDYSANPATPSAFAGWGSSIPTAIGQTPETITVAASVCIPEAGNTGHA
jgi:hypothetical protein